MSTDAIRRPPSADGMGTGTTLAVLVHVGLVAALAYGVAWRRHDVNTISAELWAAVPQVAAPLPSAPPPPAPAPKPAPTPAPPPPPKVTPQAQRDADIALEKARKKAQAEREAAEEAKRQAELKKKQDLAERDRQERLRQEREAAADKLAAEKKAAADKKAAAAAQKAEADRIARNREETLKRLNKELGSDNPAVGNNPGPSSGRATQSAAPSAGYEGRIRARILPNIIYSGRTDSSIVAEVEVRVAPDGSILGSRVIKRSGVAEWDEAVTRAIERTEVLPRDVDGRVPPVMVLSFDPSRR